MAGKRLLDLAALFSASRGVAQKHIALRSRQLDVFSRTSTIAKAVKGQTDRVTETVRAGSFLVSRLNESAPSWTAEARTEWPAARDSPIPDRNSTEAGEQTPLGKEGIEQDHFYEKSKQNSVVDKAPTENLEVQQEQANRYPIPDGTIPPNVSKLDTSIRDEDYTPLRSKAETSKEPLNVDGLNIKQQQAGQYPLPDGSIPPADTNHNLPATDLDFTSKRPVNEPIKSPLDKDGLEPVSTDDSTIPLPRAKTHSSDEVRTSLPQSAFRIPSQSADAQNESTSNTLEEGHDVDSFYRRPTHTTPTKSSLPRVELPRHVADVQGGDPHLSESGLNADTYYSAAESQGDQCRIPSIEAVPEKEEVPEGIDTALFHSPRVARLLGGKTQASLRNNPQSKRTDETPINRPEFKSSGQPLPDSQSQTESATAVNDDIQLAQEIDRETSKEQKVIPEGQQIRHELRESKVPASRLGRLWNYGSLAAGMFGGAITESVRRVSGNGGEGSFMLSASNMDRLVTKLSRMRGAALKLGQILSFQDSKMLPPAIQEVLQRVQDRADYMPPSQRNKVLEANLGPDWRDLFSTFDEMPLAAASIGQVHSATLRSSGQRVAVKVQYPGVADSIDSDLNNLALLLTASRLLPKGLFLDKTIANARIELGWECDYTREAECGRRFQGLLAGEEDVFVVPKVFPEASGKQVLTMEFMEGVGVTRVQSFTQEQKDWIGTQILRLCLREITEFQFMQTDPNWTNFLFNSETNKLELLDFGASREYPKEFITRYTQLLQAASRSDKKTVRDLSIDLGYLTGQESKTMLDAHISSVLTLAEPFLESSPEVYDFRDQTITERVKALIPVMIRERLSPPPEETYSLHRKLSGAFLLCARLGSRVKCRELFINSMEKAGL